MTGAILDRSSDLFEPMVIHKIGSAGNITVTGASPRSHLRPRLLTAAILDRICALFEAALSL